MMKNLFIKSYLHDLRIQNIVSKSAKLGCDDFSEVVVWADLIKNIPFTFSNGETWTISKVEFVEVEFIGKYTKNYSENHIKIHFKSPEKKRCTYFSLTKGKNGVRVLDLFQEYFNDEIMDNIEEKKIMSAIEKYLEEECK